MSKARELKSVNGIKQYKLNELFKMMYDNGAIPIFGVADKRYMITAKAIHSARYITFKLCSSCPYMDEFYETLYNISKLQVQLE